VESVVEQPMDDQRLVEELVDGLVEELAWLVPYLSDQLLENYRLVA